MGNLVASFVALLGGLFITAIFTVLMAIFVMLCWNAVIPYLFGLPVLTWFKAWCLVFLCHMLLKSSNTVKVH